MKLASQIYNNQFVLFPAVAIVGTEGLTIAIIWLQFGLALKII